MLRWAAERNAWACGACGNVFPATPQAPQSQPAQPRPAGFAPAAPGGFGGAARTQSAAPGQYTANAGFGGAAGAAGGRTQSAPPGQYASEPRGEQVPSGYNVAPNAGFGGAAGAAAPRGASPARAGGGGAAANAAYASASGLASDRGTGPSTSFGVGVPNAGFGGAAGGAAPKAGFGGSAAAANTQRPHSPSQPGYPPADPGAHSHPGYPSAQGYGDPNAQYATNGYAQPGYQQQQPAYPQAPSEYPRAQSPYPSAAPYQQAAPAAEPAPKKKGKGLLVAVVGVAAIGIGVGVAIAMSGGKKTGAETRDELAARALAALQSGDVDALIALELPPKASFVSCETEPDVDDAAKKTRERYEKAIEKAKGVEVELVKLADGGKKTFAKGDELGKGCKLDTEMLFHSLDATLKATGKGRTKQRVEPFMMMEVDGRWYLAGLPNVQMPGDCAAAAKATVVAMKKADDKKLSDVVVGRMTKAWEKHCTDDSWPDEAIDCHVAKPAAAECMAMLSADQSKKLGAKLDQIVAEDMKSREVPVAPPPTAEPPVAEPVAAGSGSAAGSAAGSGGAGSGSAAEEVSTELPSGCADWREQLDKLSKCRRIPLRMKRGYEGEYDIVIKTWENLKKKTEDLRTKTGESCKKGLDQVVEARKSFCR